VKLISKGILTLVIFLSLIICLVACDNSNESYPKTKVVKPVSKNIHNKNDFDKALPLPMPTIDPKLIKNKEQKPKLN